MLSRIILITKILQMIAIKVLAGTIFFKAYFCALFYSCCGHFNVAGGHDYSHLTVAEIRSGVSQQYRRRQKPVTLLLYLTSLANPCVVIRWWD